MSAIKSTAEREPHIKVGEDIGGNGGSEPGCVANDTEGARAGEAIVLFSTLLRVLLFSRMLFLRLLLLACVLVDVLVLLTLRLVTMFPALLVLLESCSGAIEGWTNDPLASTTHSPYVSSSN